MVGVVTSKNMIVSDVMVWARSSGGTSAAVSISVQFVSDVMVRALSSDAFGAGGDSDG